MWRLLPILVESGIVRRGLAPSGRGMRACAAAIQLSKTDECADNARCRQLAIGFNADAGEVKLFLERFLIATATGTLTATKEEATIAATQEAEGMTTRAAAAFAAQLPAVLSPRSRRPRVGRPRPRSSSVRWLRSRGVRAPP